MTSCGGRCRASGNPQSSTCPIISQTNSRPACANATIDAATDTNNFKTKDVNFKLEEKVSNQMENSDKRADTRDDECARNDERARDEKRVRDDKHARGNARDPNKWDPGEEQMKPCDLSAMA